ncbi:MAG: lipocalin family protein [Atopobiaceae bacterium]|nr:lipocalin family protein [Atopobiaceae bacterium]
MKKRIWTTLVLACALCLALIGCAKGSGSKADPKDAFVGTWEIVKMINEGEETSLEDLERLKDVGMFVYLDLNEDGTFALDVLGSAMSGTWEATDESTGTITLSGATAPLTIDDGLLKLEQDNSSMTFKKIDPSEKVSAAADASSATTNGEGEQLMTPQYFGGDTIEDLDDPTTLDVAVVDDDICTIKITAKGMYEGDPGIFFEITNKTDKDILIAGGDDWSIGGTNHEAVIYELVKAGETLGTIAWFDADDVGTDMEAITGVSGTIVIADGSATELLETVDFQL